MDPEALQVMDVTSLKAVVTDLRQIILPSRFEKAQQPEPGTIQIGLRTLRGLIWIEISWKAEAPRLVQISSPIRIGSESTLAKQIQHGLNKMALIEIQQNGFERVVMFCLAQRPGAPIERTLVIELMGRHSNLLLLENQEKIITLGRQVSNQQSRIRPIGTGDIYALPPALQGKEPNSSEPFKTWKDRLTLIPCKLKRALHDTYQGISPSLNLQLADDRVEKASELLDLYVTEIPEVEWRKLYKRWQCWLEKLENENLELSFNGPTDFRLWDTYSQEVDNSKNLSLILGKYYRDKLESKRLIMLTKELEKRILKIKLNEEKHLLNQQELLKKTSENKSLQEKADELLCMPSPDRRIINQAQKLYQRAKKLRRSNPIIKERIFYHEKRLEAIEESSSFLENLSTNSWEESSEKLEILIALRQELDEFETTLKRNKKNKKSSALHKNQLPQPLLLKSPGGLEIQIGRNHRQNEWISLHKSRTGDIWFHVQECPGSHGVLKASNGLAEELDIQIAADLAAFFSRANGNQRVAVLMVPTDNLHRIPGTPAGTVRHRQGSVCWGKPSRGLQYIKS